MASIKENKKFYVNLTQRKVLLKLIANPVIEKKFFLTGGTCLSVFYLHHRVSNDIDLFTRTKLDLIEIDLWIKTIFKTTSTKIKSSETFLSYLINNVKVDFVIDYLATDEKRKKYEFENRHYLFIDTLMNILSNKFCTIISRTEPKDFIDFYMAFKKFPDISLKKVYNCTKLKDAIFDDTPTVAYQLETNLNFIKENLTLIPQKCRAIDLDDFFKFYADIVLWLYKSFQPVNH